MRRPNLHKATCAIVLQYGLPCGRGGRTYGLPREAFQGEFHHAELELRKCPRRAREGPHHRKQPWQSHGATPRTHCMQRWQPCNTMQDLDACNAVLLLIMDCGGHAKGPRQGVQRESASRAVLGTRRQARSRAASVSSSCTTSVVSE
jgi:hypothetical protein